MAITSESQVFKTEIVNPAINHLDSVISNLNSCIKKLKSAKKFCNEDALNLYRTLNEFPEQLETRIEALEKNIEKIKWLKAEIKTTAEKIHIKEYNEYISYKNSINQES